MTQKYEEDRDYLDCVEDILVHPVFCSMEQYIQHGETTCREHCIQVSYRAYLLCRKHGWDWRAAARGGLLHDLFLYDWHAPVKERGHRFHGFTHPGTAAENAEKYFSISPKERQIIRRHMWPLTVVPPTSMAGMAVMWEDKVCGLAETCARIASIGRKCAALFGA